MEKAVIYTDHREGASGVIDELKKHDIRVKLEQLAVGDYLVSDRVVVERKTGSDFLQSIIDGRLFNQAEELADNFEKALVVVEGEVYGLRNMHDNAIRGAIGCLVIDFGIPVIQTKNIYDSAAFIAYLAKREQLGTKRPVRLRGEKKAKSPSYRQQFIVESLPGVGPLTAKSLLERFETLEGIFTAPERGLREADLVGKKRAKELRKIMTKKWEKER